MKIRKLIKIMFMCCALSLVMGVVSFAVQVLFTANYTDIKYTPNYVYTANNNIRYFNESNILFTSSYSIDSIVLNKNTIYHIMMYIPDITCNNYKSTKVYLYATGRIEGIEFNQINNSILNVDYNRATNIVYSNNYLEFDLLYDSNNDTYNLQGGQFVVNSNDSAITSSTCGPLINPVVTISEPYILSPSENLISGINSVSSSLLDSTRSIISFITSSNVLPYLLIGVSVSLVSVIIYFGKRYIF